ncbi:MAG: cobalamin B12-binding domain-containing protein [Verrucomicrobia bacterium]|nr:cobalamin B12-binding domain-containing protein [Deltaproteobacteria bacterium]
MKIVLAYISGVPDRRDPYISLLPTGLCSLHAYLRAAGFNAVLANFSAWSTADIRRQLSGLKPDIFGISQWTHNRHASLDLANLVRNEAPGSIIIMGGAHATFSFTDILRKGSPVDCIVRGEGEETLLEIARRCQEGSEWRDVRGIAILRDGDVVVTPPRPPLNNLDQLPIAVSFLEDSIGVDIQLQAEFVITTRGCPSACHFCSSPRFWERSVRFRAPKSIVDEITYIRARYGLIYFSLRDDTFTIDRARTIEFCRLLIDRRLHVLWNCQSRVNTLDEELLVWMKRAGCECIQLGVESGSHRILTQLGKSITPSQVEQAAGLIRKAGINLSIYLITDVPGETEDDVRQTIDLVRRIRPDDGYVSPLAYFPGTQLFEDAVASGSVESTVFEKSRDAAVFASDKRGRNVRRLLKYLGNGAPEDVSRFQEQKRLLGYCYATNVLAGEFYRQSGDRGAAELEFREIVEQEPDNPWGWYLLGELYAEIGRAAQSAECYRAVCGIVAEHGPSRQALQAKKRGHKGPAPD